MPKENKKSQKNWIKALKIAGLILLAIIVLNIFNNVQVGSKLNSIGSPGSSFEPSVYKEAGLATSSKTAASALFDFKEGDNEEMETQKEKDDHYPGESPADNNQGVKIDKKIIKNGSLSLKVERTEEASERIIQISKQNQGEVFSSNFHERSNGSKTGTLVIKVPVEKFEKALGEFKTVATLVLRESTNAKDVTSQYVDLQARLKNKKAEEQALLALLERSGEMDDVLSVTKAVAKTRGEIEQLEAQKRLMDSQVSMSTININVDEDAQISSPVNDWRPLQVVKKSIGELKNNIQGLINGVIYFAIVWAPILIFLWIVFKIIRAIWKKMNNPEVKK